MRLFRLLYFITCSAVSYGQVIIKGKVIDQYSHKPIAYTNIGIVNSNAGTLSNSDGSFSIIIPERRRADTLTFSALGFIKKNRYLFLLFSLQKNWLSLFPNRRLSMIPYPGTIFINTIWRFI